MIEINLLPLEFRRKEKKETKAIKMPDLPYLRIIGVVFVALVAVQVLLLAFVLYVSGAASKKEQELKVLGPDFERIKALKLDTLRAESQLKKLDEISARPFFWTDVLGAVSESVSDNIWLTRVESERKVIFFDLPKKPERKAPKKEKAKPEKSEKKADAKQRTPRVRLASKAQGQRVEHYLILRGSAPVSGTATASIGKFIQSLKQNAFLKTIVQNVKLELIDRGQVGENAAVTTFDFTVTCLLKVPFSDAGDPV